MNKQELISAMAEKANLSKKDAEAALNAFVSTVERSRKKRCGQLRFEAANTDRDGRSGYRKRFCGFGEILCGCRMTEIFQLQKIHFGDLLFYIYTQYNTIAQCFVYGKKT